MKSDFMKIAIIGYGKMGKMIEQLASDQGHEIVLKVGSQNQDQLQSDQLQRADVAIEFSRPESAFNNISSCINSGIPVISGTTGWLDQKAEIEKLCTEKNGAFLYASNFSIGVNIFFSINETLARIMNQYPDYAPEIEEIHHTQKLDAPSGTGITLAESLIENIPHKTSWINSPTEQADQLSIISKRIDKVPGTHIVSYKSAIDTIEIKHVAHSREGFARGAILASEWIVGKQGSFSMKDVLGV